MRQQRLVYDLNGHCTLGRPDCPIPGIANSHERNYSRSSATKFVTQDLSPMIQAPHGFTALRRIVWARRRRLEKSVPSGRIAAGGADRVSSITAVQNKSTDGSGSNQGAVAGNSASHQRPRPVQHNAEPQSGDRWIARGVNPGSGVRFSVKAPGGGRFATAAATESSVRKQRQPSATASGAAQRRAAERRQMDSPGCQPRIWRQISRESPRRGQIRDSGSDREQRQETAPAISDRVGGSTTPSRGAATDG